MSLDIWAADILSYDWVGSMGLVSVPDTEYNLRNAQRVVSPFHSERCAAFSTAHRFCFAANVGRICVVFSHLLRVELILKLGNREIE